MIASLVLFESEFLNIVSISFSALVLNELIMVAVEVTTWHTLMILSEVFTLALYVVSILFLPEYFGESEGAARATSCRGIDAVSRGEQTSPSSFRPPSFGRSPSLSLSRQHHCGSSRFSRAGSRRRSTPSCSTERVWVGSALERPARAVDVVRGCL